MPTITINGKACGFTPGQMIMQASNAAGVEIPQYCYHDGLSIVASCRICLGEVWAPNPKNNNTLEPYMGGKLLPTCQTQAQDGWVVYTDSPRAVQNQKAVMEYLLINHPLDCPVCDQSGECFLQDYSYAYGRSVSRFEESKVKQPKKDLGPNVYLYADRCIMCTRCVRFTREVTGTAELLVQGRGNKEEIDIFPGIALDNELSANVVDLCPVGALLEKDFLFAQRVWFLKTAPSIDGTTASGDNIEVHHNDGKVYRVKPRTNMAINKWWITDEVRYGWKHVHGEDRLRTPRRKQFGVQIDSDWSRAVSEAVAGLKAVVEGAIGGLTPGARGKIAVMVSPMLSCEDAYLLAQLAAGLDERCFLAMGPVPVEGKDRTLPAGDPDGFRISAEKCPNSRGVSRILKAVSAGSAHHGYVATYGQLLGQLRNNEIGGVVLTGNYPSAWATDDLMRALEGKFVVLLDTLSSRLSDRADVVLPGATWVEKAGTFQNDRDTIQAFEQAIPAVEDGRAEGHIALLLMRAAGAKRGALGVAGAGAGAGRGAGREGVPANAAAESYGSGLIGGAAAISGQGGEESARGIEGDGVTSNDLGGRERVELAWAHGGMGYNAAAVRQEMAEKHPSLAAFVTEVKMPVPGAEPAPEMAVVEL